MFLPIRRQILPGFHLCLGFTLAYLSLLVLIPFFALGLRTFSDGLTPFWVAISDPRALASYKNSFGIALLAGGFDGIIGLIIAWVLTRYSFPGRRALDAIIDLPFALPTAVAGIALAALYSPQGWIGRLLPFKVAYTPLGIFLALAFVGLPFVVRTIQPVLAQLPVELEEAAACLGANRFLIFIKVLLPAVLPAFLTGITLAFGRAVGEYGSVIFIAGNIAYFTEITPLLIVMKLEQFEYVAAASLGFFMLLTSFVILFLVQILQTWNARRSGGPA
ncbi:MAG: sulfate ABC transporter permease subunit CysT [Verrucomicrobia bacterium]|nr:sulfate ABC transporter permease subunit CysT [Verrucomicrobiota bacterium]